MRQAGCSITNGPAALQRAALYSTVHGAGRVMSRSEAGGKYRGWGRKRKLVRPGKVSPEMLREWIAIPSIAAENIGYPRGAEYMAQLARAAGFQKVEVIPTAGKPGVFATLDVGARNSLGIYFMYDVKQYDPAEWTSPPLDGRIVDRPGLGKVMIGRGATNTKGPQMALLAALHAFAAAREKLPKSTISQ